MSSLFFYYATMNAGKSADLIKANYNYIERGMTTLVLKPSIDTREDRAIIHSRMAVETPCILFSPDQDMLELVKAELDINPKLSCVFIDEVQFMSPDQIRQLAVVVDKYNVPVMCYGLRTDFQGNLFPGSSELFALADKLFEVRTICWCGSLANMVLRLGEDGKVVKFGNQIDVGGNDKYVSVCRKHFSEGKISG